MPPILHALRQSTAELLAYTVCDLFPNVKLMGGHATDLGFHYDFVLEQSIDDQALPTIEEHMRSLIKENLSIKGIEMMRENAVQFFLHHQQNIRAGQVREMPENIVQLVQIKKFHDLCPPPYLASTKEIGAFKLQKIIPQTVKLKDEELKMTRIQGAVFSTSDELKKFLKLAESAKKRDHRQLGKEMDLFSQHEEVGIGCWFWHPKGACLREILLDWWRREHRQQRFQLLATPQILKKTFLKKTGIFDFPDLANSVFPPFTVDHCDYVVSPNQAALHAWNFRSKLHSYRELPIRYAECVQIYHQKKESQLWGLLRARSYCSDICHIFCTSQQVHQELISSLQFIDKTIKIFGFEYQWYLIGRGQKFVGTLDSWSKSVDWLHKALGICGFEYEIDKSGTSFYGPRIEVRLTDAIGRKWKGPYVMIDFNHPERFGLRYQGADDEMHMPVMIARSMFGSLERFVAILIEHYAGLFPIWLAPQQVRIIPIAEKNAGLAMEIYAKLESLGFRVGIDHSRDRLGGKIHAAERERIPYAIVIGDKEEKSGLLTIRSCNQEEMRTGIKLEAFLEQLREEEASKSLPKAREHK